MYGIAIRRELNCPYKDIAVITLHSIVVVLLHEWHFLIRTSLSSTKEHSTLKESYTSRHKLATQWEMSNFKIAEVGVQNNYNASLYIKLCSPPYWLLYRHLLNLHIHFHIHRYHKISSRHELATWWEI